MHFNCPVCQMEIGPNYTLKQAPCSYCNTDLTTYLLLYSISKKKQQISGLFLSLIMVLAILFSFWYYNSASNKKVLKNNSSLVLQQYKDSIVALNLQLAKSKPADGTNPLYNDATMIRYKIKMGDCITKIAKKYYNKFSMYKQIESDNHLVKPYTLHPGQTILVRVYRRAS